MSDVPRFEPPKIAYVECKLCGSYYWITDTYAILDYCTDCYSKVLGLKFQNAKTTIEEFDQRDS
jgi:hypothetical protein